MDRLHKASLVVALDAQLRSDGSWAGETHVQKATFFLQRLTNVPLDFEFILYKHGPFSFDLRDELTALRAQGFLRLEPQYPYGPRLVPGEKSSLLQDACREIVAENQHKIKFISGKLANKTVAGLERSATALYVTVNDDVHPENRASRIVELKPHISLEEAKSAVAEVDQIMAESKQLQLGAV